MQECIKPATASSLRQARYGWSVKEFRIPISGLLQEEEHDKRKPPSINNGMLFDIFSGWRLVRFAYRVSSIYRAEVWISYGVVISKQTRKEGTQ
ncbi:MAG TPA: hypothetical protein VKF42_08300 [Chitinivibrionales bacterium]|nr:hypothetical protein [Chitinivibrionales bacterium]